MVPKTIFLQPLCTFLQPSSLKFKSARRRLSFFYSKVPQWCFSSQWLKVEVNPLSPATTTLHFIHPSPSSPSIHVRFQSHGESSFIIYFPFLYSSSDTNIISLVCMSGKCRQACVKEFSAIPSRDRLLKRKKRKKKIKGSLFSRSCSCILNYMALFCVLRKKKAALNFYRCEQPWHQSVILLT